MKNLLLIFSILLSLSSVAQDEIYYADGKMEEGKVLEVERDYLIIRNDEGVKVKVPKMDISMVLYENGSFEIYNKSYRERTPENIIDPSSNNNSVKKEAIKLEKPNQFKFNLAALMLGNAEISYQRKVNNVLAFEVPMAYGWDAGGSVFYFRKKYSFGVNILFYPLKPESAVQFHIGPGFEGGNAFVSSDLYSDFGYDGFWPFYTGGGGYGNPIYSTGYYSNYLNVGVRAGMSYMLLKSFGIGAEAGMGIRSFVGFQSFVMPFVNFNFNLQYHF